MLVCEHDKTEKKGNIQFTVIFEGTEETDILQYIIDAAADNGEGINFEQALYKLITLGELSS